MSSTLEFEVVVVGAGPGGLTAACVAAEGGGKTALIDETPWLGGQIWRGQQAHPSIPEAQRWIERFKRSGATLLENCTVLGPAGERVLLAEQGSVTRRIEWKRLILATGARELFLPFPGWSLPGNFGPGGLQSLAKHGWPVAGKRIVIAGSGPLLWAVAAGLRKMGATIVSVNEQAPISRLIWFGAGLWRHPAKLAQWMRLRRELAGTIFRAGVWPVAAEGADHVRTVQLTNGQRRWTEECDYLACGFGLVPNVELPLALGCRLAGGFVNVNASQATSESDIYAVGELTGIGGADSALVEGEIAGWAATDNAGAVEKLGGRRASRDAFRASLAGAFRLRDEVKQLPTPETVVCRCEDVRFDKLKAFDNAREAKLQTRCGMGACQGRVCGAAVREIFGWGVESVRPPILPGRVESFGRHGSVSNS